MTHKCRFFPLYPFAPYEAVDTVGTTHRCRFFRFTPWPPSGFTGLPHTGSHFKLCSWVPDIASDSGMTTWGMTSCRADPAGPAPSPAFGEGLAPLPPDVNPRGRSDPAGLHSIHSGCGSHVVVWIPNQVWDDTWILNLVQDDTVG